MSVNPFTSAWLGDDVESADRPQRGLSYVAGPTTEPLRYITLGTMLDEGVARHGGRDAAYFAASGRRWSWYDLQSRADEVATGLLALGLQRGDRVGIWAPTCEEWLGVQFGAARIGAILVPLNPGWGETELGHALNTAQCRVLVLSRYIASTDAVALLRGLAPEIDRAWPDGKLRSERLPRLRYPVLIGEGVTPPGAMTFKALRRLAGPAQRNRQAGVSATLDPDDAAVVQFTSGGATESRGATLSHYGLVNNATFTASAMRLTARDRLCIAGPLHHWFGMGPGILACVASGATMVFPAPAFDASRTLAAIGARQCTALHATPTELTTLLDHPEVRTTDLSHMRRGIVAGGPCNAQTFRRVAEQLHLAEITVGYGKSETSPLAFQSSAMEPVALRAAGIGRVHPHAEAKVVDEHGRLVPVGQRGELCLRGYLTMRGYWNDATATRAVIDAAGWLRTGDLASLDHEGRLTIVGRVPAAPL